jgi:hypothetical protein
MRAGREMFIYLDGDQKKVETFTDGANLPLREDAHKLLLAELGAKLRFPSGGGSDADGKAKREQTSAREYLAWARKHVRYLPELCPEAVFLKAAGIADKFNDASAYKQRFRAHITKDKLTSYNGEEIFAFIKQFVFEHPIVDEDRDQIASVLKCWLSNGSKP